MDCIVEYDYNAAHADELFLKKGDIIKNVVFFEPGWKKGCLNGKEGVFPDNFVKVIKPESKKSISKTDELNSNIEDNTSNKVKIKSQSSPVNSKISKEKLQINNSLSEFAFVETIFSYQAENPDEITIEVGDILKVLDKNLLDEGWWKGIKKTGEVGIFPSNFVQSFVENKSCSSIKKKVHDENDSSFKIIDNCSFNDNSNFSTSTSFHELSNGKSKNVLTNSYRGNASKSIPATKNINVSSTSMDSGNEFKGIQCFHELSKDEKIKDKDKFLHQETNQILNEDNFVTKSDFMAFRKEVEQNIGKLSIRIMTLIDEIDEEKKQRAASEIELVRIRRVVHMLDAQILNGFNH